VACTIDYGECAVVRLSMSGTSGYCLTACKTMPFGLGDIASGRGTRLLKKLTRHFRKWQKEELALCVGPETYLPLPASFPAGSSPEKCQEYCRIEAEYFLTRPENYNCDFTGFSNGSDDGPHENKLLLFYPAEECRKLSEHFSAAHPIVFCGSPQLPLLYLSQLTEEPQVILELENNYVLLTVSRNGKLEKFSCRQVKDRTETEYFAIRKLAGNPVCRETAVQITGSKADRAMAALISKATSLNLKPLSIPPSIPVSNPERFSLSSPATVKAISMALMAFAEKK